MSKPGFCHQNGLPSYDIIEKGSDFRFLMIYFSYFCYYASLIKSYADRKKL